MFLRRCRPVILILYLLQGPVAVAEELEGSVSDVVGTVTETDPNWYAIIETGVEKKLYTKGDILSSDIDNYLRIEDIRRDAIILKDANKKISLTVKPGERLPIDGASLIFEKSVQSDIVEYRYKSSGDLREEEQREFALKDVSEKKIVLEKGYDRARLLTMLSKEEKELFESPQAEEGGGEIIKAGLFDRIEIEKVGEDTWALNTESAEEAFSNAGQVLVSVIKTVKPHFRFGEGPSLKFNCELGDMVLNRDGFLVQNLAVAKFAEHSGIKQGDLIRSINGQSVNSLYGIFKAYMEVKSNPNIKVVNVNIVRDGKPKTLVYKIR
jgi:hypothetical protein